MNMDDFTLEEVPPDEVMRTLRLMVKWRRECFVTGCEAEASMLLECVKDGCIFFCPEHALKLTHMEDKMKLQGHGHVWYTLDTWPKLQRETKQKVKK
jgi:hypothetical protein